VATKKPVHVVIVDDDYAIRETVHALLEDEGYAVSEATDGLAALDLLRGCPPSVVLLDLMMPRLDGAGVLGAAAGDKRLANRHAYVLVTATSQTMPLAFVNLLINLSVPVLHKPFDINDLLDIVARASKRLGLS
jgi:CheY-like chemotaxis protein